MINRKHQPNTVRPLEKYDFAAPGGDLCHVAHNTLSAACAILIPFCIDESDWIPRSRQATRIAVFSSDLLLRGQDDQSL